MKPLLASAWLLLATGWCANPGTIHLSAAAPSPQFLTVLINEPVIFVADDAGP